MDSEFTAFDASPNSTHDKEIPFHRLLVKNKALLRFGGRAELRRAMRSCSSIRTASSSYQQFLGRCCTLQESSKSRNDGLLLRISAVAVSYGLAIGLPLSLAFQEASAAYSAGSFPAESGYRPKIAFVTLAPVDFVLLHDARI